eukprot:scaffold641_cov237-Pinguiococcus_pyrenoidosus.AAC.18
MCGRERPASREGTVRLPLSSSSTTSTAPCTFTPLLSRCPSARTLERPLQYAPSSFLPCGNHARGETCRALTH